MATKKRSLPPALKAWQECRLQIGVKPFAKISTAKKNQIRACVEAKLGKKK